MTFMKAKYLRKKKLAIEERREKRMLSMWYNVITSNGSVCAAANNENVMAA